ncbi:indole-3-glycerol phosphate synthase TrpC [Arcticibacterium luteifluviistationis]|uniref:indole-3-glycerol-phosphate synthase n=1 Tax=Arcticibacterium luteifluviistationis TaxID=1784714 RepID=A0A2Z4GGS7_9BACT|nr:indole-3-glycerol phosphate synthase TrpC [Arcticibacterium luteifluviistationis]AWW00225.1 indole-3-glycerol phosphate synthase TrpC [Arcticibacterium luteifluviistationis]
MTILDTIVAQKKIEIANAQKTVSIPDLQATEHFKRKGLSLKASLTKTGSSGIIAEFKRKSPSKGFIKADADVAEITSGYSDAGAAGMSVLTDTEFFGGSKDDLLKARAANPNTPILRKDFMVDSYQIYEAKAWGADVILLIAACLDSEQIDTLSTKAHELGLEVLLEIHNEEELKKSPLKHIDVIGVNNRNLKNFAESNVNASLELIKVIPTEMVKISESCISQTATIKQLKDVGYQGFLIGENFMKTENPGAALDSFIKEIEAQ